MTKNINRAVNLTSYFISLPPAQYIVLAMLVLGIIFGLIIDFGKSNQLHNAAIDGIMLLALPALLSSIVVKLMIRKLPFKRIAATAFCGEIVYSLAYLISVFVFDLNPFWAHLVLLVGSALVFVFWYLIARFVFILKYRSILFAIMQMLFYLIFLIGNQALYVTTEPFLDVALRFYISSFILLAAIILFFFIINAPMKKNFGLSSTDAISYFFSQWFYHNKDLEKAFEHVGESARTFVSVMGFKRKNNTIFFITPYVHFGPFGNLGGSEFSYLLAKEIDKKYKSNTFIFHGTVTHDLNPVSSSEITKILDAVDLAIKEAKFMDAKVSISIGQEDECIVQTLRVNNAAMLSLSRAPKVTEDINFGLGLAMLFKAEKNLENAMIVDQHNAETGDITSFEPGSVIGFRYLKAIDSSLSKKYDAQSFKLGISNRSVESDVIGGSGIKVAVFSSNPEYVVVLIDCNGITPEFRDMIESEVKKLGKELKRNFEVGIFTTDTHQTNITKGVLNPLKSEENTISAIKDACKEAASDMQEAKFFSARKWFDINVLGAKQSIEIISTVNSIVAVAKITLPLIFIIGILLLLAVATRI